MPNFLKPGTTRLNALTSDGYWDCHDVRVGFSSRVGPSAVLAGIALACITLGMSSAAIADHLLLKDGSEVTGEVVERDSAAIRVKVNGMIVTIPVDRIAGIGPSSTATPVRAEHPLDELFRSVGRAGLAGAFSEQLAAIPPEALSAEERAEVESLKAVQNNAPVDVGSVAMRLEAMSDKVLSPHEREDVLTPLIEANPYCFELRKRLLDLLAVDRKMPAQAVFLRTAEVIAFSPPAVCRDEFLKLDTMAPGIAEGFAEKGDTSQTLMLAQVLGALDGCRGEGSVDIAALRRLRAALAAMDSKTPCKDVATARRLLAASFRYILAKPPASRPICEGALANLRGPMLNEVVGMFDEGGVMSWDADCWILHDLLVGRLQQADVFGETKAGRDRDLEHCLQLGDLMETRSQGAQGKPEALADFATYRLRRKEGFSERFARATKALGLPGSGQRSRSIWLLLLERDISQGGGRRLTPAESESARLAIRALVWSPTAGADAPPPEGISMLQQAASLAPSVCHDPNVAGEVRELLGLAQKDQLLRDSYTRLSAEADSLGDAAAGQRLVQEITQVSSTASGTSWEGRYHQLMDRAGRSVESLRAAEAEQAARQRELELATAVRREALGRLAKKLSVDAVVQQGEPVSVGDWRCVVKRCRWAHRLDFGQVADGSFLIISLDLENTGKKPLSVPSFTMYDTNGNEYESRNNPFDDSILAWERVNPGVTKSGRIVFDVPQGPEYLLLVSDSALLEGSRSVILLAPPGSSH